MSTSLKPIIRKMFPNGIDNWILYIQKEKDRQTIREITRMNVNEYPAYLKDFYYRKTKHALDLENPRRLTEKIQWRKLYDQNVVYSLLSDKYFVRKWVTEKIGDKYLIPLLGCWKHFDDIRFESLPEQFVLKTNNASHTNIIVTNKKDFLRKKRAAKKRMEYWLGMPFALLEGLELHYAQIQPVIIAEEYIRPDNGKGDLTDYKFHCFNGIPYMCQVIGNRTCGETIDFYTSNWKHIDLKRPPYDNSSKELVRPENYEKMLEIAQILSSGFQYVRVDLFENREIVYFGEMTFTPASGIMIFEPDEWDYKLGAVWDINRRQVDETVVGLGK